MRAQHFAAEVDRLGPPMTTIVTMIASNLMAPTTLPAQGGLVPGRSPT